MTLYGKSNSGARRPFRLAVFLFENAVDTGKLRRPVLAFPAFSNLTARSRHAAIETSVSPELARFIGRLAKIA
jgi:hypothetical protein